MTANAVNKICLIFSLIGTIVIFRYGGVFGLFSAVENLGSDGDPGHAVYLVWMPWIPSASEMAGVNITMCG